MAWRNTSLASYVSAKHGYVTFVRFQHTLSTFLRFKSHRVIKWGVELRTFMWGSGERPPFDLYAWNHWIFSSIESGYFQWDIRTNAAVIVTTKPVTRMKPLDIFQRDIRIFSSLVSGIQRADFWWDVGIICSRVGNTRARFNRCSLRTF